MSALKILGVFAGMAVVDALWSIWVQKVAEKRALAAGFASVAIYLIGAFVVTEYVHDRVYMIPAAVGGFVGTALPIWWKRRREQA
jgi:hypothetical protein